MRIQGPAARLVRGGCPTGHRSKQRVNYYRNGQWRCSFDRAQIRGPQPLSPPVAATATRRNMLLRGEILQVPIDWLVGGGIGERRPVRAETDCEASLLTRGRGLPGGWTLYARVRRWLVVTRSWFAFDQVVRRWWPLAEALIHNTNGHPQSWWSKRRAGSTSVLTTPHSSRVRARACICTSVYVYVYVCVRLNA